MINFLERILYKGIMKLAFGLEFIPKISHKQKQKPTSETLLVKIFWKQDSNLVLITQIHRSVRRKIKYFPTHQSGVSNTNIFQIDSVYMHLFQKDQRSWKEHLLLVFMLTIYINIYLYKQITALFYIYNCYVKGILKRGGVIFQGDIWNF